MKYYHPVELNNLSVIQKKVFKLVPLHNLNKTILFYLPNNLEIFFNIPELKAELDRLGWTEHVDSFGFYIVQKTNGSTLHTDTGSRTYSFNIPIISCTGSRVNFYTTDSEPEVEMHKEGVDYNKYDIEKCTLVDSLEMTIPHIINVKEVHNISNPNHSPRITLLIRMKNTVDLRHLFYETH